MRLKGVSSFFFFGLCSQLPSNSTRESVGSGELRSLSSTHALLSEPRQPTPLTTAKEPQHAAPNSYGHTAGEEPEGSHARLRSHAHTHTPRDGTDQF